MNAFDRNTPIGQRDYAIAHCLLDLALRAGDVANIRLDDFNWRDCTITLLGGKNRRADVLPLPRQTARAITSYLRNARPQVSERILFICHNPPVGRALGPLGVRNAIRYAAKRAGMAEVVTGTRILRQTAATRMLRSGATLKEIADVLRHRCIDTTMIYTKVDLDRLTTVAMPWPGGKR